MHRGNIVEKLLTVVNSMVTRSIQNPLQRAEIFDQLMMKT